jgi:hypothetical protein
MQQQRANWYEWMEHFSITGYQVKSQQKEEGLAFKELSAVLWKVIQKQENVNKYIIQHKIQNKPNPFPGQSR